MHLHSTSRQNLFPRSLLLYFEETFFGDRGRSLLAVAIVSFPFNFRLSREPTNARVSKKKIASRAV